MISNSVKQKYFFARGLTSIPINRSDLPVGWDLLNRLDKSKFSRRLVRQKKLRTGTDGCPEIDPAGESADQRFGAGAITGGTGAAAGGAAVAQRLRSQASSANLAWPRTAMYSLR